uniref:Uncharacterized protein n=1 Tax=Sinocyclocheilus anshuiensis TaxID=1608454 RepID=A0A671P7W7_9TELE
MQYHGKDLAVSFAWLRNRLDRYVLYSFLTFQCIFYQITGPRDLYGKRESVPQSNVFQSVVISHNGRFSLFFSPDGSFLAAGSADGAVYIWNVSNSGMATTVNQSFHFLTILAFPKYR